VVGRESGTKAWRPPWCCLIWCWIIGSWRCAKWPVKGQNMLIYGTFWHHTYSSNTWLFGPVLGGHPSTRHPRHHDLDWHPSTQAIFTRMQSPDLNLLLQSPTQIWYIILFSHCIIHPDTNQSTNEYVLLNPSHHLLAVDRPL
jgi:hypothetical protein